MLLMKPTRVIPIPPHKASLNLPRGTEINASDVSHTHLSRESLPTQYSLSQTIKVGKTLCTRSNYSHPRWTLCAVLGNVLLYTLRQRIEPPTVPCVWLKHHFCAADQLLFELSDTAPRRITQSIVIVRACYSLRINRIAANNFRRLLAKGDTCIV